MGICTICIHSGPVEGRSRSDILHCYVDEYELHNVDPASSGQNCGSFVSISPESILELCEKENVFMRFHRDNPRWGLPDNSSPVIEKAELEVNNHRILSHISRPLVQLFSEDGRTAFFRKEYYDAVFSVYRDMTFVFGGSQKNPVLYGINASSMILLAGRIEPKEDRITKRKPRIRVKPLPGSSCYLCGRSESDDKNGDLYCTLDMEKSHPVLPKQTCTSFVSREFTDVLEEIKPHSFREFPKITGFFYFDNTSLVIAKSEMEFISMKDHLGERRQGVQLFSDDGRTSCFNKEYYHAVTAVFSHMRFQLADYSHNGRFTNHGQENPWHLMGIGDKRLIVLTPLKNNAIKIIQQKPKIMLARIVD